MKSGVSIEVTWLLTGIGCQSGVNVDENARVSGLVGAWDFDSRWFSRTRTRNADLVARHVELSTAN